MVGKSMLIAIAALALQAQTSSPEQPKPEAKTEVASRCVDVAESPDARVAPKPAIAPGPPPLLSFRYFDGKLHHRFNNLDLMLDDAGH